MNEVESIVYLQCEDGFNTLVIFKCGAMRRKRMTFEKAMEFAKRKDVVPLVSSRSIAEFVRPE